MSNPLKSDWVILAEICQERGINMAVVVRPEKFKDQVSVTQRAGVIREGHRRGISETSFTALTPFSRKGIQKILRNGTEIVPEQFRGES